MGVRIEETDHIDLNLLYHNLIFQKTEYINWQNKMIFLKSNQLIHLEDLVMYPIPKF